MAATDTLKEYLAWYAERAEPKGILAKLGALGRKKECQQKAEKLGIVINLIERLPPKQQKIVVTGMVLFSGRIRAEINGRERLSVEEFDELIGHVNRLIEGLNT